MKSQRKAWKGSREDYIKCKPFLKEMGLDITYEKWLELGNSRQEIYKAMGDVDASTELVSELVRRLSEAMVLLTAHAPEYRGPWTESVVQHLYETVAHMGKKVDMVTEIGISLGLDKRGA